MATTETLFILEPLSATPTSSSYATVSTINDTSTPPTTIPVILFEDTADSSMDWHVTMPSHYDDGGLTISWKGAMDGTATTAVELEFRCVVVADSTTLTGDLTVDGTTTGIPDTPGGTADVLNYSTTGTITHANAGSPSPGDRLIIRATRDVSHAANADNLQLLEILILET